MAQWKETQEPYVKVTERIKTTAVNPTAGEDLIVGIAFISDSGPSTPTLITSQKEFLATYASQDITEDYMKTIDALYGDTTASTMWLNAYRLAGSGSLLCVRAMKGNNIYFAKPLEKGNQSDVYILKDGQMLKKVQSFKLVIDYSKDNAVSASDGWSISINGVGVVGNRITDEGSQTDTYVRDLEELVEFLNDSPSFFSSKYTYYTDANSQEGTETTDGSLAKAVIFEEVYLGSNFLDKTDPRVDPQTGMMYMITCEPEWREANPDQRIIDLNDITAFAPAKVYATNDYNASNDLKVRIRRFNHDAVVSKELDKKDANANGESPYVVLESVLKTYEKATDKTAIEARDFYEIAVYDPSVSPEAEYYNLGKLTGRGDMDEASLNSLLNMVSLQLPDSLKDLGLGYYGFISEGQKTGWVVCDPTSDIQFEVETKEDLPQTAEIDQVARVGHKHYSFYTWNGTSWENTEETEDFKYAADSLGELQSVVKNPVVDDVARIGVYVEGTYYKWQVREVPETEEIYVNLSIDPEKYAILNCTDADLQRAIGKIEEDEVYQTEGLCDLGNSNPAYQSFLANVAVNSNYFYPISTINSTNYLAIANGIRKISKKHYKLYSSAPWDIDEGTAGLKFYAAPSTLYWETVFTNRGMNREFGSLFGQLYGTVAYQKPVTEFNKRQRQLLLSEKVNTVSWNVPNQTWVMNWALTKQSEDNIMSEDGNSRLFIRISKSIPSLLRQFIGQKINETMYSDMENVLDFWFKTTILPLGVTIADYRITIADINNDEIARQNKVKVLVECRYQRSAAFIEVYNDAYDVGMAFTSTI